METGAVGLKKQTNPEKSLYHRLLSIPLTAILLRQVFCILKYLILIITALTESISVREKCSVFGVILVRIFPH